MLIDVSLLMLFQEPQDFSRAIPKIHTFPTMYALSKTGAVRVYVITVEDMGDHAVLTTRKKSHAQWQMD